MAAEGQQAHGQLNALQVTCGCSRLLVMYHFHTRNAPASHLVQHGRLSRMRRHVAHKVSSAHAPNKCSISPAYQQSWRGSDGRRQQQTGKQRDRRGPNHALGEPAVQQERQPAPKSVRNAKRLATCPVDTLTHKLSMLIAGHQQPSHKTPADHTRVLGACLRPCHHTPLLPEKATGATSNPGCGIHCASGKWQMCRLAVETSMQTSEM